nr:hypothetical protein [uncultured Cohaesibacter sp.]
MRMERWVMMAFKDPLLILPKNRQGTGLFGVVHTGSDQSSPLYSLGVKPASTLRIKRFSSERGKLDDMDVKKHSC